MLGLRSWPSATRSSVLESLHVGQSKEQSEGHCFDGPCSMTRIVEGDMPVNMACSKTSILA
jgi:hypothetical protein